MCVDVSVQQKYIDISSACLVFFFLPLKSLLLGQLLFPLHPVPHHPHHNAQQGHVYESDKRKSPTRIPSTAHGYNRRRPSRAHKTRRKIHRRCRRRRLIAMQINEQPVCNIERRHDTKAHDEQRNFRPYDMCAELERPVEEHKANYAGEVARDEDLQAYALNGKVA